MTTRQDTGAEPVAMSEVAAGEAECGAGSTTIRRTRLEEIRKLSEIRGPHAGSGCQCNQCLQAVALRELYLDYREVRAREEQQIRDAVTW